MRTFFLHRRTTGIVYDIVTIILIIVFIPPTLTPDSPRVAGEAGRVRRARAISAIYANRGSVQHLQRSVSCTNHTACLLGCLTSLLDFKSSQVKSSRLYTFLVQQTTFPKKAIDANADCVSQGCRAWGAPNPCFREQNFGERRFTSAAETRLQAWVPCWVLSGRDEALRDRAATCKDV